jgi:hypothetical protein
VVDLDMGYLAVLGEKGSGWYSDPSARSRVGTAGYGHAADFPPHAAPKPAA